MCVRPRPPPSQAALCVQSPSQMAIWRPLAGCPEAMSMAASMQPVMNRYLQAVLLVWVIKYQQSTNKRNLSQLVPRYIIVTPQPLACATFLKKASRDLQTTAIVCTKRSHIESQSSKKMSNYDVNAAVKGNKTILWKKIVKLEQKQALWSL